jgi:DNA invertase Pin-like site-specific DNA recombinase
MKSKIVAGKTLGYLRTSTDKQEINNQRLEILEYARKEDLKVSDFIEAQVSSRKSLGERKMGELFEKLNAGDILIVTELSRIGRSTIEVLSIVKELVQNGIDIVFIKQMVDEYTLHIPVLKNKYLAFIKILIILALIQVVYHWNLH